MSALTPKLRNAHNRLFHWCPGCMRMHPLPLDAGWTFDGNIEAPTLDLSLKHSWGGNSNRVCHYMLTAGVLKFCGDSTHELAGQDVPLPDIPEGEAEKWGL